MAGFLFSKKITWFVFVIFMWGEGTSVLADGMVPETTVVILHEEDGEATINVKNTDAKPALLYSSIENLPEDPEFLALVTPPITRVEPSEKQLVRVIGQFSEPLKTQRLKRVIFEGVPPRKDATTASVGVTIRQNLPLIIHPRGLEKNPTPWTLLEWSIVGDVLQVRNESPYVVRLSQEILLTPQNRPADIGRTYVLPGEVIRRKLGGPLQSTTGVTFYPATVYGFTVASYAARVAVQGP
ncbi:fimbria/pilus chaperone family protein [Pseudomonas sp. FP2196]|uniref:fimbria/pilus chaperone family protein n=1 Tax=Pseudomonas sp. FP2196 TaxID=2954086 RepID=UPI00273766D2|nr:fimbria/pilus chaperone family protein [Pseudomonas sp. FP2196]WLH35476.1 fimbria/pilus chaperone family protein [Pseudomonas sp. FP2196]